MKKIVAFLFLVYLNSITGYCQLLSKPSLAVEDFEIALTNTDHLRKILKKHNFEYSTLGETKLISPVTMPNPLMPDLRAFRSEDWELKNQKDQAIWKVSMYEWKTDHAPHPDVIRTITVTIRRDSTYADKTNEFFGELKNKYPNKSKRYFRDSEFYKSYGEPLIVFTNDSKIEVRVEKLIVSTAPFYVVCFDLVR